MENIIPEFHRYMQVLDILKEKVYPPSEECFFPGLGVVHVLAEMNRKATKNGEGSPKKKDKA